jgi:hypothetical protein
VAGELFRGKRRPGCGNGGREIRWRVHGQVDQGTGVQAPDNHPAESVAVVDPLRGPAALTGSILRGIARGGNVSALGCGEEVEVFSRSCREVLCEQGRSPASRKPLLAGRAKNSLATSS